jgi:hypothetical protein
MLIQAAFTSLGAVISSTLQRARLLREGVPHGVGKIDE